MKYAMVAAVLLLPAAAAAQSDSTVVTWGGFLDAYYAYHFNLTEPGDAPLLTQPVRHNEFNANLAFIEAKIAADRLRGRVALQVGTSVSANYAGEPTHGAHSGPDISRHIQEAVVGYRVAKGLWLDGGIFLSHIGGESWISRDNWTYTRSMIAEYSPYYEAGVRATWSPSDKFSGMLALLNGWQNISETNSNKAAGVRLDYVASPRVTLGYSNFLGNEAPEGDPSRLRFFNDFIVKLTLSDKFGFLASVDVGTQDNTVGAEGASWWGMTAIAHLQASSTIAIAGRGEYYSDPDGVFISTVVGPGIKVTGASLNFDYSPVSRFLWRTEFRVLISDDDVFEKHDGTLTSNTPFVVSSFAVTF